LSDSGCSRDDRGEVGSVRPSPARSAKLSGGGAKLVPTDFVGRLETLLAPILAEDAGRFKTALEATVQLFERLTLSGMHEHVGS
jgi:hypothetical protein